MVELAVPAQKPTDATKPPAERKGPGFSRMTTVINTRQKPKSGIAQKAIQLVLLSMTLLLVLTIVLGTFCIYKKAQSPLCLQDEWKKTDEICYHISTVMLMLSTVLLAVALFSTSLYMLLKVCKASRDRKQIIEQAYRRHVNKVQPKNLLQKPPGENSDENFVREKVFFLRYP